MRLLFEGGSNSRAALISVFTVVRGSASLHLFRRMVICGCKVAFKMLNILYIHIRMKSIFSHLMYDNLLLRNCSFHLIFLNRWWYPFSQCWTCNFSSHTAHKAGEESPLLAFIITQPSLLAFKIGRYCLKTHSTLLWSAKWSIIQLALQAKFKLYTLTKRLIVDCLQNKICLLYLPWFNKRYFF